MTHANFMALLPLIITGYFCALLMIFVAFKRSNSAAFVLTLIGLGAALISVGITLAYTPRTVSSFLIVDWFSLFFTGLVLAAVLLVAMLSHSYFKSHVRESEAFYLLLLLAVLGMETVVSSIHFVSFFLGVEILSVSLYGLIGYTREYKPSLEAAIKYLVLTAASSAFLLFGIAMVYTDAGTMNFQRLTTGMAHGQASPMMTFGLAMILVLFGFKLAIAPFHMWSPDVYQGAPAPTTALIATGSKGAVFALLLRLVTMWDLNGNQTTFLVLAVLAVATMFIGNLLALMQTNVKRLLAYSSIAHIGYLLIPLLAGGTRGPSSIAFYLVSYFAATITAFGVIAVLSATRPMGDTEELADYRGLSLQHPVLAAIFALAMLSLTGIPPTAGFIAKFYIFSAAAQSGLWWLLIVGIINSGISAFYYLRVVAALYSHEGADPLPGPKTSGMIALVVSTAVMVVFGIYPSPLIRLAQIATQELGIR